MVQRHNPPGHVSSGHVPPGNISGEKPAYQVENELKTMFLTKQKCLLTTWGTKYEVILIIVVAMTTGMEAKIKCWLILRQYLVTMATR